MVFTVTGGSLTGLSAIFLDSSGSVHMWLAYDVEVINGSFHEASFDSISGQAGDALEMNGTFVSATQLAGSYSMTVSGITQTGSWTAAPSK